MLPEEQEAGQELVLPENDNNQSGSIPAIYLENHEDDDKTLEEAMKYIQESDYPTEESKSKIICKSFKIDKNEILNQDEKLKVEAVKMFLDNFLVLALYLKHYGKTDVL